MRITKIKINSFIILLIFSLYSIVFIPLSAQQLDTTDDTSSVDLGLPVYRAVFVGIGFSQGLPYSIKQINGLKTTLLNGGNWDESNIQILTDSQATENRIKKSITWLEESADDNDVSLFYFIGHGGSGDKNQFLNLDDGIIFDYELDIYLENVSGSVVVILDSCKSGGFIDDLQRPNRVVLTASNGRNPTFQVDELEAPMFSYFLNLSLSWLTKNIELTFLFTKIFTLYYSDKISDEYGEDYHIYPQMYDGSISPTRIIRKHAFVKQLTSLFKIFMSGNNYVNVWEMTNEIKRE